MYSDKTFEINGNIDFNFLLEFAGYINNIDCKKSYTLNFNFNYNPNEDKTIQSDVDSLFFSYVLLFVKEVDYKLNFNFNDINLSDRAYSVLLQVENLIFQKHIDFKKVTFKGEYLVFSTGEIKPILLSKKFNVSQKFTPSFYIDSNDSLNLYFNLQSTYKNDMIFKEYKNKLLNEVKDRKIRSAEILSKIENLNYIETCILTLLLSKEIYDKRNTTIINKAFIQEEDEKRILNYIYFVTDLSIGLKELAKNIFEHSTSKKGVINCRLYDKERLLRLKSKKEVDYFNYIDDYYLDINVIDFGEKSIRQSYIEKLEKNDELFQKYSLKDNFKNDIEIIKNEYEFSNFYYINFEKYKDLKHQQNKVISRFGLQYFGHLILKAYSGLINISSISEGISLYINNGNVENTNLSKNEYIPFGTVYQTILPIHKATRNKIIQTKNYGNYKGSQNINSFKELFKYKIQDIEEAEDTLPTDKDVNLIYKFNPNIQAIDLDRDEKLIKFYYEITSKENIVLNNILLIDSNLIGFDDPFDWIKILSAIGLIYNDIIIYNIELYKLNSIIKHREGVSNELIDFWSESSRVLFYAAKESKDKIYKRFGATLLSGKSIHEYQIINKNIWRNHYSYYNKQEDKPFSVESKNLTEKITKNSKLFSDENLIYFELLISNKKTSGYFLTLFEESVQYSLNKTFNVLENTSTNNKGYKILDTHFRLGSKIHIKDFFYAKRLFQNSFFTTPLSFLLAKEIIEQNRNSENITLLGYEDYSSFLISSTRNILERQLGDSKKINHCTINKDKKLSINPKDLNKNIIIIVPIASTFSTGIKLENDLNDIINNPNLKYIEKPIINQNFINIILVGHEDTKTKINFETVTVDEYDGKFIYSDDSILKKDFNWESIDKINRKIKISTYLSDDSNSNNKTQKYFIPVYTHWYSPQDCELCNPKDINNEKCLIETGKLSITPSLIFGFPKTKKTNEFGKNELNLKGALLYGNLKKNKNNYLYFLRSGFTINDKINNKNVIDWLSKIKEKVFQDHIDEFKKIVVVTPSSGSKSKFLDLINDKIFNYTANCLFISLEEDYIQNAESLYADGLHNADIVVYVDDALSTINSFLETNYIVKYIRKKSISGKGIDYCLTLINRMSFDTEQNLILKLNSKLENNLIYFSKLNNHSIEEPNNEFPLIIEQKRYETLARQSSLDPIKEFFLLKVNNLNQVDLMIENRPSSIKDDENNFNKKLYQLLVLNEIYTLFEADDTIDKDNVLNYFGEKDGQIPNISELENYILNAFATKKYHKDIFDKYNHNLKNVILKIICSSPLIHYQDIRNTAFSWIIIELEILRKKIDAELNSYNIIDFFAVNSNKYYSDIQTLKFLLKRAVQLKSNYIIHNTFLESLKKLINLIYENQNVIDGLKEKNKELFDSLVDFFYTTEYHEELFELKEYIREISKLNLKDEFEIFNDEVLNVNSHLFVDIDLKKENYIPKYNKIESELFDDEIMIDENEIEYFKVLNQLKLQNKYYHTTSRNLVYYLVALVQELIHEHDTKSLQLEENLKDLGSSNNENGSFNHFIRLLKLENTAVIDMFWQEFKLKELKNTNHIEISTQISNYENNPKYKYVLRKFEDKFEKEFKKFIELRSKLHLWKNKDINISEKINELLQLSTEVLENNVEEAILIINYKNNENPEAGDLFAFETFCKDNKKPTFDVINNYEKSFTKKMFDGLANDDKHYSLSNFEIIKNNNELNFRENICNKNDIEDSIEYKHIKDKDNYSILFIRISDIKSGNKESENELYTKAVLVFFINSNKRIDEKLLRLMLMLRRPIGDFITTEITKNTLLELLRLKSIDEYQSDLKHGVRQYLTNLGGIIDDIKLDLIEDIYEKLNVELEDNKKFELMNDEKPIENVFNIIREIISGQIGAYELDESDLKIITINECKMKNFISMLFTSKYIGEYSRDDFNENCMVFKTDEIKLPNILYKIVLPELIVNMKKHSCTNNPNYNIIFENDFISFENSILDDDYSNSKKGLIMCRKIISGLNGITLSIPNTENNKFIIKIEKNENTDF